MSRNNSDSEPSPSSELFPRDLIRAAPGSGGVLPRARIYGRELLAYQSPGKNPETVEHTFVRQLHTPQAVWRLLEQVVSEEWTKVELGWISFSSMYRFENLEGRFTQVQPSLEERTSAERKCLEIGTLTGVDAGGVLMVAPFLLVPPREVMKFTPVSGARYYLRSRSGPCRYSLTIYPN